MNLDLPSLLSRDLGLKLQACSGQVIIVTGAGQGIGLQIARTFALLGGKVVLAELSELGQAAEQQICSEGGQAFFIQTDVSDPKSVARMARTAHEHFGSVDVLVNNAIFIRQASALEMPLEMWDRTIAVNLRGAFLTCQVFLPDMVQRKSGTVLNLVSTDAMPGLSAYIASKQGLTGFSQSLAQEVGPAGVRVIAFAPGMVDTPGIRSVAEGLAPRLGLKKEQFLNLSLHAAYDGLMPPEHAGAAAAYLVLRLADEFHGQVVNGYEVLERAGLLHMPESALSAIEPLGGASENPAGIVEIVQQLMQILADTETEFNRLPVFVRPMARGGFKNKAGQSLLDWQRSLTALAGGAVAAPAELPGRLDKLSNYFREVPKETARFTRDPELLRQVAELSRQRLEVIAQLKKRISNERT